MHVKHYQQRFKYEIHSTIFMFAFIFTVTIVLPMVTIPKLTLNMQHKATVERKKPTFSNSMKQQQVHGGSCSWRLGKYRRRVGRGKQNGSCQHFAMFALLFQTLQRNV